MAYDDKELNINGDTYRRYEGRLDSCKFCHNKYHSIYGYKNINPRDLVEFIKDFGVVKK